LELLKKEFWKYDAVLSKWWMNLKFWNWIFEKLFHSLNEFKIRLEI
jgi:hypothetical protein